MSQIPVPARRRLMFAIPLVLAGLAGAAAAADEAATIETRFAERGPLAVSRTTVLDGNGKRLYEIFAPAVLRQGHPIVVWGNGTGAVPRNYEDLLAHFASWGLVAIDTYERNTGSGAEILAAAQYMAAQNATPGSPFFGRLDPQHVGAAGHSQGATGVINAATNYGPESALIRTVVPIALPSLALVDDNERYDTSKLTVPLFIIGGTEDVLISPLATNKRAFNRTDDSLPAAMGMKRGADHNEIQPDGGRDRGYLTAWMMFQLFGEPHAAQAFSGPDAELLHNPTWASTQTQNLP